MMTESFATRGASKLRCLETNYKSQPTSNQTERETLSVPDDDYCCKIIDATTLEIERERRKNRQTSHLGILMCTASALY